MIRLGVNIDHIATLRQARKGNAPEPALAAAICEAAGADSIVAHLREDRRHINEKDIALLRKTVRTRLNMEMSIAPEIVCLACAVKPDQTTLVPERRQELTTEGGLDAAGDPAAIRKAVERLQKHGIEVSLFIDPEKKQIDAAKKTGARISELHTGRYADAPSAGARDRCFKQIRCAAQYAAGRGLAVAAGHGLDYGNTCRMTRIREIEEFNIGYSIICRAVFAGLDTAVREMKSLMQET